MDSPNYELIDCCSSMQTYRLRLDKSALDFSSAHFLTLATGRCARLHGHNYHVSIVLHGLAGEDGWVVDFSDVKRLASLVSGALDHRVLLPSCNAAVSIREEGESTAVSFFGKSYQFPSDEVVLLPVPNTTAECLAGWYAERLGDALAAEGHRGVTAVEIEIEESDGQAAGVHYDVRTASAVSITAVA
jgi:6-pyruvoyltetrahydropterin/6-carboxytetrahydropterin synthase